MVSETLHKITEEIHIFCFVNQKALSKNNEVLLHLVL